MLVFLYLFFFPSRWQMIYRRDCVVMCLKLACIVDYMPVELSNKLLPRIRRLMRDKMKVSMYFYTGKAVLSLLSLLLLLFS